MWLREGCCSDAEKRGFTPHACAASVCQGAIIGGLSLGVWFVCTTPHTWKHLAFITTPLSAGSEGLPRGTQATVPTCVAVSMCCNCSPPLSLDFLLLSISVMWMSVLCLAQLYTPIASQYRCFRTCLCLLSNGDWCIYILTHSHKLVKHMLVMLYFFKKNLIERFSACRKGSHNTL